MTWDYDDFCDVCCSLRDTVRFCLENPRALTEPSLEGGYLPLHVACFRSVSLEIIQFLVDQYPDSVAHYSKDGELPLHSACASTSPKSHVIRFLVERYPQGAAEPCLSGFLPLHWALIRRAPLDTVELLMTLTPDSKLAQASETGRLVVHEALDRIGAKKSHQVIIRSLVQSTPVEAFCMGDKEGRTPLSVALEQQPVQFLIVLWVIQRNPAALLVPDHEGALPIHRYLGPRRSYSGYQCHHEVPLDVVTVMVGSCLQSLLKPDMNGDLPLHRAVESNEVPASVVEYLADSAPDSLSVQDNKGRNGLLRACHHRARTDVVKCLLQRYDDEVLQTPDELGRLPLLHAILSGTPLEIVRMILGCFPRSVEIPDHEGKLALHHANERTCLSFGLKRHRKLVRLLILQFPAAQYARDRHGHFPLHVACESDVSVEFLFELVRGTPDLLAQLKDPLQAQGAQESQPTQLLEEKVPIN